MDPIEHMFLLALWTGALIGLFLAAEGVIRLLLWLCTTIGFCARLDRVL